MLPLLRFLLDMGDVAFDLVRQLGGLDVLDKLVEVNLVDALCPKKIFRVYNTMFTLFESANEQYQHIGKLTFKLRAPVIHSVRPSMTLPT